ncbi:biopolymer transporter ExbD [Cryomorpha ignava]|uniref:Biopolymer transporter ExbD n=1 Tax=Cryomorpha ignava TaxID=101383 RepID=A0A7K3WT65_9FLAO|nr:biopolymer transporter ExbD [Cryomorpha ignava]NEN23855.1 biopolymer transporter ExbD [Cryomorpha ignava]
MYHRAIPSINAGSMADIAFLLLVFFLVTTTLDQDLGIKTVLPPINPEANPSPRGDQNVLEILINGADELMIEGERKNFADIKSEVRNFYTNPDERSDLPRLKLITPALCKENLGKTSNAHLNSSKSWNAWKTRLESTELIGPFKELPKNAVISLQNDRSTSYATYILVQNELNAGLNALRNECSEKHFGMPYGELDENNPEDRLKIRAIRMAFPRRISEAEPVALEP